MSLLAIVGLLIIEDVQDDLSDYLDYFDFLDWETSQCVAWVLKYYVLLVPSFLPLVLPIALLVSILFALGNLHRCNEIVALRASGLHLVEMTRSLLFVGGVFSAVVLYFNASLVPYAVEQSRTMRENLKFESLVKMGQAREGVGLVYSMTFDNRAGQRLWVMNRFSQYTLEGYGVTVYRLDDMGREVSRIMARRAFYDNVDHRWVMVEGRELTFNVETGSAEREQRFDEKIYASFNETPTMMLMSSQKPQELSFLEVGELLTAIPPEDNADMIAYAVRYQMILASPFACLIAVAIGVPFAVAGVRTNPIVNISKAAALFFVFFVLQSLFRMFGVQQVFAPMIAAWLPNVVMCGVAVWLWRRAR